MPRLENGFVYLWALFAVTLAGIVMAGTGQIWQTKSQREKETELLYVGDQFHKAIMSYHSGSPGGARQYPQSLEDLLQDNRTPVIKRHLRKIYLDPITNTADWGIVEEPAPAQSSGISSNINPGIIGVYSLSKKAPVKKDNFLNTLLNSLKPRPTRTGNLFINQAIPITHQRHQNLILLQRLQQPLRPSPRSLPNNTGSKAPAPGFPSAK